MPRLPVRLTKAQKEWVENQAESRGCSQSDVVQQLVAEARGESSDQTLEERVSALEQRIAEIQSDSVRERSVESERNQAESLVDSLRIPGDADEQRARREFLIETLAWMQGQDSVRRADVVARWDGETLGYETGEGLWESLVKPALDELREQGIVEKPNTTNYRWVD